MMQISVHNLTTIIYEILMKAGSDEAEATIVTDHLVRANLTGHDSHGVGMVPHYISFIAQGLLKPNTGAQLIKEDGSLLVFDGQRGYGQRTAAEAMAKAVERCREKGLTIMVLRNAHHIGRVGTYGEQSIGAGFISIHFVNVVGHGVVAPSGGRDARLGTNPLCIAIPGTNASDPFLLDMATSKIPMGKVHVAANKGKDVPDGSIIDEQGYPTNDPTVMFGEPRGSLLPLGAYKGYGIALACELLAGALGGGGTVNPLDGRHGSIMNNMLTFVIDPKRLVDMEWMQREVDMIITHVKESPAQDPDNPVLIAGDPERRSLKERHAHGIEIPRKTWDHIRTAAETLGITQATIDSFLS